MRILVVVTLLLNSLFANEYLESIYENILIKNTKTVIESTNRLQKTIQEQDEKKAKELFSDLVKEWKSVQAFYILGDLDSSYIDIPRYIDTFHHGNEDITVQLQRIVQSDDDLSISLFKHSFKTINALEYILFEQDIKKERVKNIALQIVSTIRGYLQDIKEGYTETKKAFVSDEQKANAMMLNALIETSYKLKEWRVGDPAGLSRKYKKDPDNTRGEYFLSQNSFSAIKAILDSHLNILDKKDFKNYGALISSYDVKEELQDAITNLKDAKQNLSTLEKDDFSKAKPLFRSLKKVHISYYITLIGKLKITAKVLDADGD